MAPASASPIRSSGLAFAAAALALALTAGARAQGDLRLAIAGVWIEDGSGWHGDTVAAQLADLAQALAPCGIAVDAPSPAELELDDGGGKTVTDSYRRLTRAAREAGGVSLVFVQRLSGGEAGLGGGAFRHRRGGHMAIAFEAGDGRPRHPAQTLAHETGHLLGLGHDDRRPGLFAPGNIMQAAPCRGCAFTRAQCDAMRESPLLTRP